MSKRILLTGATGYLGSQLTEALLANGYSVIALKRRSSSLQRLGSSMSKITLLDVDDLELSALFKDYGRIGAVIHTATSYGRNGETASKIVDANLSFPIKLMDAAIAAGVNVFLNTDTALDKLVNAYTLSKSQFREWGYLYSRQKKIHFLNLKLEHFYGPGDDDTKFTTHVIKSCLMNAPELKLTLGEQKRDFIYIDDVIAAYLLLLAKQESFADWYAEFDVGSGAPITIRQFVEFVHQLTGSKTRLNFGAYPYREGEVMFSQTDIEPLQKLGWCCKHDLEQGLKLAIKGYEQ